MRVIGIDPSSSMCGLAAVEVGKRGGVKIVEALSYESKVNGKDTKLRVESMARFQVEIERMITRQRVKGSSTELIVVEQIHVAQNTNTVRLISYYEAVALMTAMMYGTPVMLIGASAARSRVLGDGRLSKEKAFWAFMDKHDRSYKWPMLGAPGFGDSVDACITAIGGALKHMEGG